MRCSFLRAQSYDLLAKPCRCVEEVPKPDEERLRRRVAAPDAAHEQLRGVENHKDEKTNNHQTERQIDDTHVRLTPQFSGGALNYAARRMCTMKCRTCGAHVMPFDRPLQLLVMRPKR